MRFRDTPEAQAFVASGDSRLTDPEIMRAIVFFARCLDEAEELWRGDGFGWGLICHPGDFWERVTRNGLYDPTDFSWGIAGRDWWQAIRESVR